MWGDLLAFLIDAQTQINRAIATDVNAFAASRDWMLLASVLPLGILFGAVHALTPGHSKTVLASYLAGSPFSVLRRMGVGLTLSFTHVLTAVLIAVLALPLITVTLGGAGRAPLLQDLSRAMLAGIGVWMLLRAWRRTNHHHHASQGMMVGVMAGLIPCPLTLFVMIFALSRGVPEAGIVFAISIMLGVALTLSVVAILAISVRSGVTTLIERYGGQFDYAGRFIKAAAGILLILIGVREILFS
jgi:ABC-type nickel/cobalt efflux system permease component RcnA